MALPSVTQTESTHAAEHIAGAVDINVSNEQRTVLSGQNLLAGAVVGAVQRGIGRITTPTVVGTGNGTVSGVTTGPDVELGSYVATCTAAATNAGTFSVTTPSGLALPPATVAVAYTSRHLNFTIADGSSDYIVGDSFTFVVSATAPAVTGAGDGTISALTLGRLAQVGTYSFVCTTAATHGGTFRVTNPSGAVLGDFVLSAGAGNATAFSTEEIGFTITDGSSDFTTASRIAVVVYTIPTRKVVAYDPSPASYDGRHVAAGVLWDAADASSGDVTAAVTVRGPVAMVAAGLGWGASVPTAERAAGIAQLNALGIAVL
jgi:hypothetical protein